MQESLPYKYRPRAYQMPLWEHMIPDAERKRAVILAHRRWGKDLLCINIATWLAQKRVGTYWHILPYAKQARQVVWNGKDKNGRAFRDYIPKEIVHSMHENEMRIHFVNGSIWQCIGGDDFNKHVGANPVGIVFSEWSIMDPHMEHYCSPILLENDGWSIKIFTVRGKNHAWKDLQRAEKLQRNNPNWLAINQTVNDTFDEKGRRVFTDDMIQQERDAGKSEQFIQQEYYNDPEIPIEGAYYLQELSKARADGRITSVPYDPKALVNTAWDIGYGDFTVCIFFQVIGHEIHIIDHYANSGEEVGHYISALKKRDYNYGEHYGPWDVDITHLAAGGKSVHDVFRSNGIKFRVMPQPRHVIDGIEQCRNVFPRLWIDEKKNERLLEALAAYRKEPMNEKLQRTGEDNSEMNEHKSFKDKPLHDWSSDYCDAFRVMGWSIKSTARKVEMPQKAVDDYRYV